MEFLDVFNIDLSTMTLAEFIIDLVVLLVLIGCFVYASKVASSLVRGLLTVLMGLLLLFLIKDFGGWLVIEKLVEIGKAFVTELVNLIAQ